MKRQRRIKLTNAPIFCLVDEDDYEYLSQFKWRLAARGYAVRSAWEEGISKLYYMHREVFTAEEGMDVEHKDQNRFNNQKSNLRSASRSQNMANVRRVKDKTSHSKYKGVSRLKRKNLKNQWLAYIKKDYKTHYLGYYATQEEAAEAYNAKAIELYGDFASLNEIHEM